MNRRTLADRYLTAREEVEARGYAQEIDWQEDRCSRPVSESEFLAEAAWVILCSGMREAVVRAKFPAISDAFLKWRSARLIHAQRKRCASRAKGVFSHSPKIDAIVAVSSTVAREGLASIVESVMCDGICILQRFPFIGPITAAHLAKNIGLDVVKPDRHLQRVASRTGYDSAGEFCQAIADELGERVAVIDVVVWRYATLEPNYLDHFS